MNITLIEQIVESRFRDCKCESGSAAFEAVHPIPRVETTAEGKTPLQAVFAHSPGKSVWHATCFKREILN